MTGRPGAVSLGVARARAVLGSLLFFVLAPGFVAGLVPFWISRWRLPPPATGLRALQAAGAMLIVAGLSVVLESFWRFATKGLGTPAPVAPPRRLVVSGLYRHVRNPMYLGVVAAILGQGLLFRDLRLLGYGVFVASLFHVFVLAYEEPTLTRAYPDEYAVFRANVPRWIPRLRPWGGLGRIAEPSAGREG